MSKAPSFRSTIPFRANPVCVTRYGYISFEKFVDAIQAVKDGKASIADIDKRGLPTLANTIATGAILEAGRRSLDEKRTIEIVREGSGEEDWSLK